MQHKHKHAILDVTWAHPPMLFELSIKALCNYHQFSVQHECISLLLWRNLARVAPWRLCFWKEREFLGSLCVFKAFWDGFVIDWSSLFVGIYFKPHCRLIQWAVWNTLATHKNATSRMICTRNSHMACEHFFFFLGSESLSAPTNPPPQAWGRRRAQEDVHFFPSSRLMHCSFHTFPQTP